MNTLEIPSKYVERDSGVNGMTHTMNGADVAVGRINVSTWRSFGMLGED